MSLSPLAHGADGASLLRDARSLYESGQYFKSARYAFAANEADPSLESESYAWIAQGLTRAGLHNAASYFFIRTLQSGNKSAIRRVLTLTEELQVSVGGDLLRPYLIRHTGYEDYTPSNKGAYLYSLGKDALLKGRNDQAIQYINGMVSSSPLWPFALHLRATAYAVLGQSDAAIRDYKACEQAAPGFEVARHGEDLKARCIAGQARTLYQIDRFVDADRVYDQIQKVSIVWPEILFEQAWNSFGRQEYNRSLGKLVSYKSPALSFVFNTEVDVLRAQAYLALCLYDDANGVINEFNSKYASVGEEVKKFVEGNASNLVAFHAFGKKALGESLYTKNEMYRMANRFVRGPYFQNLVAAERAAEAEVHAVRRFDSMQPGVGHEAGQGFPGFLDQVLSWRLKSIRLLGGAFVKNSLLDYHSILIADFEKMAFIKLEMLSRAKDRLVYKRSNEGERSRGNIEPTRRDDQFYWSFNGEFWNDELGDYVFGLESECKN